MDGKYNSIGRVSDCGSESFWFESRYLPISFSSTKSDFWYINPKKTLVVLKISILSLWFLVKNYKFLLNVTFNLGRLEFILSVFFKNFFKDNLNHVPTTYLWKLNFTKSKPIKLYKLGKHLEELVCIFTLPLSKKLNIHKSFDLYYYTVSNNIGLLNVSKFSTLWHSILTFLMNIFYFKLSYIIFTNPYFRYEALALNFKQTSFLIKIWKLTSVFIFFIKSKATLKTELFFLHLTQNNFKLSFIVDFYYHKIALYYLRKFNFITIGPIPVSSDLYALSIAFPVNSNSTFSNLFFFRFLLKIKKLTLLSHYSSFNKHKYSLT